MTEMLQNNDFFMMEYYPCLKKNELNILDENTSNLDYATENIIFELRIISKNKGKHIEKLIAKGLNKFKAKEDRKWKCGSVGAAVLLCKKAYLIASLAFTLYWNTIPG